jgi:hypothetical protein
MSDNLIFFPGYLFVDGHYLHHCRKYKTLHALVDGFPLRTISAHLLGTCGGLPPSQTATSSGARHDHTRPISFHAGCLLLRQGLLAMSGAKLFDNREALANAAALIEIRAATVGPRQRRKEFAEAQERRVQLLTRDNHTVRVGPTGLPYK